MSSVGAVLDGNSRPGVLAAAGDPPVDAGEGRTQIWDLVGSATQHGADGQGGFEPLARSHWPSPRLARAERLLAALPVACRDVIDDDVPGDVLRARRSRATWLARSPMTTPSSTSRSSAWVPCGRTIGSPSGDHRVGELREQHRAVRVRDALLVAVVPVVQPDADDLAWSRGRGRRREVGQRPRACRRRGRPSPDRPASRPRCPHGRPGPGS